MKTIEDVFNFIGLDVSDIKDTDSEYTLEINDSDDYYKIYSKLCKVLPDYFSPEDTSTENVIKTIFFYENFDIIISADFDNDKYELHIEEDEED